MRLRLLGFVLVFAAACHGQAPVGKFYSEIRSRGGIGALLEFAPDGGLVETSSAIVEYHYSAKGERIVMTTVDSFTGKKDEENLEFRLTDINHLFLRNSKELTQYTRFGNTGDDANPLLGQWTMTREANGMKMTYNWSFRSDGLAVLTVPLREVHGKYSLEGKTISLMGIYGATASGPWRWDGQTFVVPGPRVERRYRKLY